MTLTKGILYAQRDLKLIGWTEGDGTGSEGYNVGDYFHNDAYLGADPHGIEPIFDDESAFWAKENAPESESSIRTRNAILASYAPYEGDGVLWDTLEQAAEARKREATRIAARKR